MKHYYVFAAIQGLLVGTGSYAIVPNSFALFCLFWVCWMAWSLVAALDIDHDIKAQGREQMIRAGWSPPGDPLVAALDEERPAQAAADGQAEGQA